MKKGKEIQLNTNPNYSIYSGSVDNKNAKTIYLNISSWGNPISDLDLDYEKAVRNLRRSIMNHLYQILSETNFKKENTIVDLDMRSSGIVYNKKSFMSCEVTFFQKLFRPVNSEHSISSMKDISNSIIDNILETNQYFKFSRKK
jgi:hypothetical protein